MMRWRTDATPCPEGQQAYPRIHHDSIVTLGGDNTEDIDFTTEFRASLRAIKPRRRQTAIGPKKRVADGGFLIYEDHEVHQSSGVNLKGSILAKPPQRPKQRVNFLTDINEWGSDQKGQTVESQSNGGLAPAPIVSRDRTMGPQATSVHGKHEEVIKRPARRGTVYIPPDDTTMPSMHMGIFSPIKDLQFVASAGEPEAAIELTGLAAQMAKKRGRRESLVAAPAKRMPFQPPAQPRQESASPRVIAGKRTGKENIPPGQLNALLEGELDETKLFDLSQPSCCNKRRVSNVRTAKSTEPSSAFGGHQELCLKGSAGRDRGRSSGSTKPRIPQAGMATQVMELKRYQNRPSRQPVSDLTKQRSPVKPRGPVPRIPSKTKAIPASLVAPSIAQVDIRHQYPLLSDDISDPSLYEDSWLTHQEIAITQLVNTLFQTAQGARVAPDAHQLRHELLNIYQHPSFSLLHKRLQASLLYGALRIPKESLTQGPRLWTDLGRRERFCSFWLDTYDLNCLTIAAEVVIGRQCLTSPRVSQDGGSGTLTAMLTLCPEAVNRVTSRTWNASRRSIRAFLERFLIRNEDGSPDIEGQHRNDWCCQRTLLRSLMLIKLLDVSKATCRSLSSLCLFLSTSPHKSSGSVVKALAQMLNPALGDILRLLSHLDYSVDHKQYPLEEYPYHIDNLAVDLRDGVMLTRLVELLLYPSSAHSIGRVNEAEATTSVAMPGGQSSGLGHGEQDWPLSQHLKFPCLGQSTKVYNVQLALNALAGVRGIDNLLRDVSAEDIVNGFREKTVALLWGLTGEWGLEGLLDWADVHRETRRLSRNRRSDDEGYSEDCVEGLEVHKSRLKAWASAVASRYGLEIKNWSTSFADGRVFASIVKEYTIYLDGASEYGAENMLLHERLERLGCSAQFVKLIAPIPGIGRGRCFDKDFVIAALAFLCSRLLSATKRARAAMTIQRQWRRFHSCEIIRRQRMAKCVAEQCMAVIRTREKLLWAKTTIWKAWRGRTPR